MKKIISIVSLCLFSMNVSAGIDVDLRKGTMVCSSKNSIENFLELKEKGYYKEIKDCRKLRNFREVELEKRYPIKGYIKVEIDGKNRYIDKNAIK